MSEKRKTVTPQLPDGYEVRFRPFAEFRAEGDEGGEAMTIIGHASTFDDPYDLGPFEEQVASTAFDRAIRDDDVRALYNHDPNHVLGRTKSGTLRLSKDDVGLVSEIDLPASATNVREAIRRGDVDQMSFAFRVTKESWEERDDDKPLRTLEEVELWDVSPVTFPANPNTDVGMRSLQSARTEARHTDADADVAGVEDDATVDRTASLAHRRRIVQMWEAELGLTEEARAMSDGDLRDELDEALRASEMAAGSDWIYVRDVFSDDGYLVFRTDGGATLRAGLYRVDYALDGGSGVVFGEPVRVRRVTTYEPVEVPGQDEAA